MKKIIETLIFSSAILVFATCKNTDSTVTPTTATADVTITANANGKITFASVNPIFIASCSGSGCHNTSEKPLFVNSYSMAYANGGPIVSAVINKRMPQNGTLTTAQIAAIKQWQTDGFLEK